MNVYHPQDMPTPASNVSQSLIETKRIFGRPSEARIEKISGAFDQLGRSILELYLADSPDLIRVYPFENLTTAALKSVDVERRKEGWFYGSTQFETLAVNWSIKYRHNKINDIVLLEAVDMNKKDKVSSPPKDESDELCREIEVLRKNKGVNHFGPESKIKWDNQLFVHLGAKDWDDLVGKPDYSRSKCLIEMGLILDADLKRLNSVPQVTQEQMDRELLMSVAVPEPTVEKVETSDTAILSALNAADIKIDETPSPDVGAVNELDGYLQRQANGAPNPDPKPPVQINATPSTNGKETPPQIETSPKTGEPKTEASLPVSPKPLTVEDWTIWEKTQKENLDIGRDDLLKALDVSKYSQWTGTLEEATKAAIGYCNQARARASAKHELEQAGIPMDVIVQWLAEAGEAPKASDPLSIAQWLDPMRSRAIHYNATRPEPERAIVPVEPKSDTKLTVPSLPMRAIKMPTMDELSMMQTFAKAVASSKLYKDIDTVDKALVILWKGFELGVSFGAALDGIYIINGRPWPGAMILKAVVDASGLAERFDILNDGQKCRVIVKRKGRDSINEYSYSIEDAKTAGLYQKMTHDGKNISIWPKHEKRMIAHRAVRHAVISEFPDIAAGIGMDFNGDDED